MSITNIDYFEIEEKLNTLRSEYNKDNTDTYSINDIQYDNFNDKEGNALFDGKIVFD